MIILDPACKHSQVKKFCAVTDCGRTDATASIRWLCRETGQTVQALLLCQSMWLSNQRKEIQTWARAWESVFAANYKEKLPLSSVMGSNPKWLLHVLHRNTFARSLCQMRSFTTLLDKYRFKDLGWQYKGCRFNSKCPWVQHPRLLQGNCPCW